MRLSEKTVEINICAELSALLAPRRTTWFGLTQRQEAAQGFDAWTDLPDARALFLQFKASNLDVGGLRRFVAPHPQLARLAALARYHPHSVFYVFPLVGTDQELVAAGNQFLPSTWLLDAAHLTTLREPRTASGSLRRSQRHYVDINPPDAYFRSEPQRFDLLAPGDLVSLPRLGLSLTGDAAPLLHDLSETLGRHAVALLLT